MSVRDLTKDEILEHLKKNTVLRNKQLSVLVKLLNSIETGSTLAIDGAWGSGKTVFVKQLQMLADEAVEDYGHNTFDDTEISKLREHQEVVYFNAWENDYIGDALGAILLKLIADSGEGLNEVAIKRALSILNPSAAIKKITYGFVDLNGKPQQEKLLEHIKLLTDRHEAVNEFLDAITTRKDKKRLIFVIDELDRCKPSFAIDLLEVIKHYFVRDDVTFIVATNITQLSYTVEKYYGNNFDGYGYLNKFIDYTITLSKVDTTIYAREMLNWSLDHGSNEAAQAVISHYNFSMREINALHSSLRLIINFLNRNSNWDRSQYPVQLIYVPLALGLKIRNGSDYMKFVGGSGGDILRDFLDNTKCRLDLADISALTSEATPEQRDEAAIDSLISQYESLMIQSDARYGRENFRDFHDAISLIGSYTTIKGTSE